MLVLVACFLLVNMSFRLQNFKASALKNVIDLKRNLNTEAFLKLTLRATPQEPRIKAGNLGQAINRNHGPGGLPALKFDGFAEFKQR